MAMVYVVCDTYIPYHPPFPHKRKRFCIEQREEYNE